MKGTNGSLRGKKGHRRQAPMTEGRKRQVGVKAARPMTSKVIRPNEQSMICRLSLVNTKVYKTESRNSG